MSPHVRRTPTRRRRSPDVAEAGGGTGPRGRRVAPPTRAAARAAGAGRRTSPRCRRRAGRDRHRARPRAAAPTPCPSWLMLPTDPDLAAPAARTSSRAWLERGVPALPRRRQRAAGVLVLASRRRRGTAVADARLACRLPRQSRIGRAGRRLARPPPPRSGAPHPRHRRIVLDREPPDPRRLEPLPARPTGRARPRRPVGHRRVVGSAAVTRRRPNRHRSYTRVDDDRRAPVAASSGGTLAARARP